MRCLYRDDEIIYAAMSVTERFEGIQNNINSFGSLNNYSFLVQYSFKCLLWFSVLSIKS